MNLLEKLNWRYATKTFDPTKKIPAELFEELMEALRLSPSSYGLQPWKFVVVENAELREKLRPVSWNQGQITDASHLVVLCRKESFGAADVDAYIADVAATRSQELASLDGFKAMLNGFVGGLTAERYATWASEQVYLALGVLLTACAVNDVDACPMEGFDASQYDEILGLKAKGLRSVVVCTLGYRSAEDKYADAKKVRSSKEKLFERL